MLVLFTLCYVQFEPIRIFLNISGLSDDNICKNVGQTVSSMCNCAQCRNICTEEDIVTASKLNSFNQTIHSARDHIQKLVGLRNTTNNLNSLSDENKYIIKDQILDYDISISLFICPLHDKEIASEEHIENPIKRPDNARVYVSPLFIPDSPQDSNSPNNTYYYDIIHEFFHSLGLKHTTILNVMQSESLDFNGAQYKIITSPSSRKYAKSFFGADVLFFNGTTINKTVGIILNREDYHVSSYYHYDDVMTPYHHNRRITGVTAALLEDLEWYDIDYAYVSKTYYLNSSSLIAPITNFTDGKPQVIMPRHYYCKNDESDYHCSFDFLTATKCGLMNTNMSANVAYRNNQNYYNPLNLSYYGQIDFQYLIGKDDIKFCQDSISSDGLEIHGKDSRCLQYKQNGLTRSGCFSVKCGIDNAIYFYYGNNLNGTCTKQGQEVVISDQNTIICPNPEIFCKTFDMTSMNTRLKFDNQESYEVYYIGGSTFVVFTSISAYLMVFRKKDDSSSESLSKSQLSKNDDDETKTVFNTSIANQ